MVPDLSPATPLTHSARRAAAAARLTSAVTAGPNGVLIAARPGNCFVGPRSNTFDDFDTALGSERSRRASDGYHVRPRACRRWCSQVERHDA